MTTRNNFDQSSSGLNIECTCFYDTDRSHMDFKDNFEVLQHSSYRTSSVLYYIDNGNVPVPGHDEIKFTVKGERSAKIKKLVELSYFEEDEIQTWDDDTINQEILNYYEVNLIDYAQDKLDIIDGLEFVPTKNLVVISSSGYSQGDYSTIIYCPDDLEKAWGNKPDENQIQKMVNHYLWDAPIYARCEIDGKEYNIWDMPGYDDYEWDRDKFIDWIAKESGIDKEKFEEYIPENPSYD